MRPQIVVSEDPADHAADLLAGAVERGGHVVLTGGSTPRAAYERLSEASLDWSRATLWFTDERCVGPDHEHSNFRMAKEALFDHVPSALVERVHGELGPEDGAADYELRLRRAFGEGIPEPDLVLLGVGPDGHVCSMFPNDAALAERERAAVGVATPGMAPLVARVTLTLPVVNAAREVVFLVRGEDKAEAVARAFGGAADPGTPASLVEPASGRASALLDPAAASLLREAG